MFPSNVLPVLKKIDFGVEMHYYQNYCSSEAASTRKMSLKKISLHCLKYFTGIPSRLYIMQVEQGIIYRKFNERFFKTLKEF